MTGRVEVFQADDYRKGAWRVLWRDKRGRPAGGRVFNGEHPERDAWAFADHLRKEAA